MHGRHIWDCGFSSEPRPRQYAALPPADRPVVELSPVHVVPEQPAKPRAVWSLLEMRRENVVIQSRDLSCGAAALATLLRYEFGDNVTEKEIAHGLMRRNEYIEHPEIVQVRKGSSLLHLKRYVQHPNANPKRRTECCWLQDKRGKTTRAWYGDVVNRRIMSRNVVCHFEDNSFDRNGVNTAVILRERTNRILSRSVVSLLIDRTLLLRV